LTIQRYLEARRTEHLFTGNQTAPPKRRSLVATLPKTSFSSKIATPVTKCESGSEENRSREEPMF